MKNANLPFIVIVLILSFWLIVARKERKIAPIIVAMCFLPGDTAIVIGGLHFQAVRVLGIIGVLLIFFQQNEHSTKYNYIDKLFITYQLVGTIIYIIASVHTTSAIIYKGGNFVDSILLYIVFRHFIKNENDIKFIIKCFTVCIVFLLPFVISEYFYQENLFSIVGRTGIHIRAGEVRTKASFSHAILFGSFAAALYAPLWEQFKNYRKKKYLIPVFLSIFYTYVSSGSGPIVCLAAGIILVCSFNLRLYSATIAKWGVAIILFVHFAREKPIWHLLYVRVHVKASSTGYHRYMLVETAIKELKNWWLLGYGDVGPDWHLNYWVWTHAKFTDITNHYLIEGLRGGLFTMILFIFLCYFTVKALIRRSIHVEDTSNQRLWWGIAVMMLVQCVGFLSVAFFGQITALLYLTIALAAMAEESFNSNRGSIDS